MKKLLLIFFLVINHASSWGQKDPKPKGNCTEALAMKTEGKWLKQKDLNTAFAGQQQEAYQRLDQIHQMIMRMCPKPVGVDVRWKRSIGLSYFGTTRKYYSDRNNVLTFDYGKLLPIASFSYFANFSPHFCDNTGQGIVLMRGEQNESSAGIGITINTIGEIAVEGAADDTWTRNGYPVRMLNKLSGEQWKGYDLEYFEPGFRSLRILIHRKGELPYKPVSRRLYLDHCISYYNKLYDDMIRAIEKRPLRTKEEQEAEKRATLARIAKQSGKDDKKMKAATEYYLAGYKTDEQLREEELVRTRKIKDAELKKFTDELEKTTIEGKLDSPAVIAVKYYSEPVFVTGSEKGHMLVIEDPDYIRKDLPAYIPQMIVFSWTWRDYPPHIEYERLFTQDFPIEMLQAMIDK
jgi:hypothetical protein